MFTCSSLLPGKPNSLQHYEFIELLSPEALQELQQAVGCCFHTRMPTSYRFSRIFWWGIGQFCAAASEPSWDPKSNQPTLLHANCWWRSFFLMDPQALFAAESSFRPWSPPERTRGASAWAPSRWGLQSGHQQMPHQLDDAELDSSIMAEAASPVMASSKPTSVPSWARCSHDCLSRWNSCSGKTFRFFFLCKQKIGAWETTRENKILFHMSYTYVIGNFPSTDVFGKRVQTDKSPIVWNANGQEIQANLVVY